nr:hypothetical protein [Streptomyces cavernae]
MGVCALLLTGLVGCGSTAPDTTTADVQRLLDRRAAAVLDGDAAAFAATSDASAAGEPAAARAVFANLRHMPLAAWSYRLTQLRRSGTGATADAELGYRVDGYDRAPVRAARTLRLTRTDGRWYVASDRPARGSGQQLWEQGPVRAVHGERSLVLGVGQPRAGLRDYADLADRAVPAVSRAWRGEWSQRVVVLVPKTLAGMAALLGAPASGYRGIAAVTTGEAGASARSPADRIIVNPEAYGLLGDLGRRVVLTHETTHVATRAQTSAATPLWLSEGYADWVGYLGSGRTAAQAAPELRTAVREGRAPERLPADGDFAFAGDAARLARAYEGGWLACTMIAGRWGPDRLAEFYRAVGTHGRREGAVAAALREVLGTTEERFTAEWREYVGARLR